MALTPTVGTGQIINPTWGNQIRDRTIQTFATLAELNSLWSTAPDGSMALTLDQYKLYTRQAGVWNPQYNYQRATFTFDAGGLCAISHGLGRAPVTVVATPHQSGNIVLMCTAVAATTFTLRALTANTGANYVGALIVGWWAA